MKIGLVVRAYSTAGLAEQVGRNKTIAAELKPVAGKLVIVVTQEFERLRDALDARQELLDRYARGQVLNADREVSVMENEAEGFVPLFEYACRVQARQSGAKSQTVNATHSGVSSYSE